MKGFIENINSLKQIGGGIDGWMDSLLDRWVDGGWMHRWMDGSS